MDLSHRARVAASTMTADEKSGFMACWKGFVR